MCVCTLMLVIYTHILYHFYTYYLSHLILHGYFCYVLRIFLFMFSRFQIKSMLYTKERKSRLSLYHEIFTERCIQIQRLSAENAYTSRVYMRRRSHCKNMKFKSQSQTTMQPLITSMQPNISQRLPAHRSIAKRRQSQSSSAAFDRVAEKSRLNS